MSWKIVPVSDFLLFFPSSLCLPSLIMIITPSVQASVSGLLRSAVRLSSSQSRCWPFFFHYSVDGHFGWFSVSDVVNRVALKTHVYVSLWNKIFFLNLSPEVGLLDHMVFGAPLVAQAVKNPPAMWETRVRSLGWGFPWRRKWQPNPVFLPGESQGQRSLVGCNPWGCRVGYDWATFTFTLLFNGISFLKTLHAVFHNSIFILIMN